MHLRSVPEVSTSFFFLWRHFSFSLFLFPVWFMSHSLNHLLVFSFCCAMPLLLFSTYLGLSQLSSHTLNLTCWGRRTMCFLSFWEKVIQKTDVWSVFGRWDAQNIHQLWCSKVGLTLKIFSFSWHWTSCLILDPNFSEPNVSGYCFYTYLSVLNNSWCPESQLPSIFHTAAI